jgi:hypothetical protein
MAAAFGLLLVCCQPQDSRDGTVDAGEAVDVSRESCGEEDVQTRYAQLEDGLFESCSEYLGSIHVPDTQLTNMTEFTGLRRIHGRLSMFRNEDMESLGGLETLERAGGLVLSNSVLISDFTGLEGLKRVDGGLMINSNFGLRSLDGLTNLKTVGGELRILGNNDLESLNGLGALERIEGDVTISATDELRRAEIEGFLAGVDVGGTVDIQDWH